MAPAATAGELNRFVPRLLDTWTSDAQGRKWQEIDGTLCFVDISGFTKLSERLAERGRIGAEELVVVLNRVFGDMLDIVYSRGGQLLKFGGDALLLFFDGPDNAVHAASAAVEMRRSLRSSSQIPTSVGRVPLKMSIGVHSGAVHFFRVGSLHNELIVTGPGATAVTDMETLARPGEILVSEDTLERLPAGSAKHERGGGFLLSWRKARLPPMPPVTRPEDSPESRELCIAPDLRELLASGHVDSEHRVANLAFVQFKGIDARIADDGPEAVAGHLDDFISGVQDACAEEQVTFLASDVSGDGGKVILTTGAPFSQEDDAGRILRTARSILDQPGEIERRIGINQGHVFLGEVGTIYRSAFTVVGDAVNLAARLMAAAPMGASYVSPTLVTQSRTLFSTDAVPPFHVKGKTEPVRALHLGAETGVREDHEHYLPLVGRDDELRQLINAIERNLLGQPVVATLVAQRGFGKTRLVAESVAELKVRSFTIQADPYSSEVAYRAFRDTARRLLGVTRSDDATMEQAILQTVESIAPDLLPMAPLLGDLAHVHMADTPETSRIDPQFRAARLSNVVVDLLERTLLNNTLLVVEDAHWMDEGSQGLLQRIEQRSRQLQWAIVVTRRPEPGGYRAKNAVEIELGPLQTDDVCAAINDATEATPLRPDEVAALADRISGNPLFLEEMVRNVKRQGGLATLPESLDSVLSERVDQLPPFARRLLRSAAVLGRSFRHVVLAETLGPDNVQFDSSTEGILDEFIEPDGEDRLRFRHAILRDSLYESLPFRRRQEVHLRAGLAIETLAGADPDAVAGILNLHFLEGHDYAKAWHYGRVAGDDAKRRFANVEAAAHYRRAIEAVRHITADNADERYQTLMSLGDVCILAGRNDEAITELQKAAKTATSATDKSKAHLTRAKAAGRTGSFNSAFRQISAGRRALGDDDGKQARQARASLSALGSTLLIGQQRPEQAQVEAARAIEEATEAFDHAALALAQAHQAKGIASMLLTGQDRSGDLEQAFQIYRELEDLPGLASVTNTLGAEAYYADDWTGAVDFYEQSRQAYLETADDAGAALAAANIGEILVQRRRHEEALPLLREASRTLRACGELEQIPFVDLQLGRTLLGLGRASDALTLLDSTAESAKQLRQHGHETEAALLACLCLLDLGLADTARARKAEIDPGHDDFGALDATVELRIILALGDHDEAKAIGDRALTHLADGARPDAIDLVALIHGHHLVAADTADDLSEQTRQLRKTLGIS